MLCQDQKMNSEKRSSRRIQEVVKNLCQSSRKIQEAEEEIELKDIREETKNEGRGLSGKVSEER